MPSEPIVRLAVFAGAFILFSGLEAMFPRRQRRHSRTERWLTNGMMLVVGTVLLRGAAVALPLIAALAAADYAAASGIGVLNFAGLPLWLEIMLAVILLDFAVWLQHLLSHKIPVLWRIHRVHHADHDFDASTALRFHPIEIFLSAVYKLGVVLILGPTVLAVVLFEIILNASAMFNHANLTLPQRLDTVVRSLVVTPDMHRVHHSVHRSEHDQNYGFCLSIWDRIFRTYTAAPRDGHAEMTIGLANCQDQPTENFGWSLWLPVRR